VIARLSCAVCPRCRMTGTTAVQVFEETMRRMVPFWTSRGLRFSMRTLLCVGLLAFFSTPSSQSENPRRVEAAVPPAATSSAQSEFDAASLRLFNFANFDPYRDPHPTPLRCRGVDGELLPNPTKARSGPQPQGRCSGIFFPSELIGMAYASGSGE